MSREVFISVDVESDGPIPGDNSMLSFGAVVLDDPAKTFYRELKPISNQYDPAAVQVLRRSGLDREKLAAEGSDPKTAMEEFRAWIAEVCGPDGRPIFVSFNATYDWMFAYWYLMHFTGSKPFGHSGLDIKAYYMGALGKTRWAETGKRSIDRRFRPNPHEFPHTHNGLDDAREQAELFRCIKRYAETQNARRA